MKKNVFEVAKFEFLKIIKKKSFWLATLFMPILIGVIALISGLSSENAAKLPENPTGFSKIYVYNSEGILDNSMLKDPFQKTEDKDHILEQVKKDNSVVLVEFSDNFFEDLSYRLYLGNDADFIGSTSLLSIVNSLIKQSATIKISDPYVIKALNQTPSSVSYVYNDEGEFIKEGYEKYLLPVASMVVFFLAVYISSSFLLQSVSAEKENRMIETILSIVDKKSLMFGKMLGLLGVMFVQLFTWVVLGLGIYRVVMMKFSLPFPIDFSNIDTSLLPLNIFLVIAGFLFFAAIMTGVGAIGTGAEDSRNLSSIFILLSMLPMYLMGLLITNLNGSIAVFLSYFPFTSFMVLLIRNSFGALSLVELVIGICTSILYVILALLIAFKLFELGCLMYNRRPSFKEILEFFRKR